MDQSLRSFLTERVHGKEPVLKPLDACAKEAFDLVIKIEELTPQQLSQSGSDRRLAHATDTGQKYLHLDCFSLYVDWPNGTKLSGTPLFGASARMHG
jgi:hypothetical protein